MGMYNVCGSDSMNGKKLIAIRTILIILTVTVMATIFILSADTAEESDAKSEIFSDSLAHNILENFDTDEIEKVIRICVLIVRKTAHFAEYAVLGFLLASVCKSFYLKPELTVPISFLTGTLYAVSDEIHQYFVPGRSCQFRDVLIDSSGVICGIAFLLIIISIRKFIQKKKNLRAN